MLSPYRFRGKLQFEIKDPGIINSLDLENQLLNHFKNIGVENLVFTNNVISFSTFTSLLSLEHPTEIRFVKDKEMFVEYLFNFGEIYKIILMTLLFTLFFIKFSWWIFVVIASFFTVALITINIHYVNSFIKRNIIAALVSDVLIGDSYISKAQKEWMENPLKCSACGNEITEYNIICHNCGLKIVGKKIKSSTNVSTQNIDFQYQVKPKEDEKNSR